MAAATLQPAAGAAGELTGLLLMRAYHDARGERRHRVIIPDSAHGTNPASVTLGGYEVDTVAHRRARAASTWPLCARCSTTDVAGIMLTNPNTLGLFEEDIVEIAAAVHEVGGLLYYDGANLNAILGVVRPGRHGLRHRPPEPAQDLRHPPRRRGPGAGPGRGRRPPGRLPARPPPGPTAGQDGGTPRYGWATPARSIGRVHGWHGNALVLARALAYIGCTAATGCAGWPSGGAQRQLAPRAGSRGHLRRALRPAVHARGGRSRPPRLQQADRGAGALDVAKRPARGGLPRADGLLPPDRRRGADDRADRDRELRDPGGAGRGARAGGGRGPGTGASPGAPGPPRSAGSTRPGRPGPSSPPSTPAAATEP